MIWRASLSIPLAFLASPASAQDVYGPSEREVERGQVRREVRACEDTVQQDGAIIVCRQVENAERYLSPLPREVDPQIRILPGFEPPPCENNLLSFCGGIGRPPPPPAKVDLDAIPDALTDAEAAAVVRAD